MEQEEQLEIERLESRDEYGLLDRGDAINVWIDEDDHRGIEAYDGPVAVRLYNDSNELVLLRDAGDKMIEYYIKEAHTDIGRNGEVIAMPGEVYHREWEKPAHIKNYPGLLDLRQILKKAKLWKGDRAA